MSGPEYIDKGAILSTCGKYRYLLWREWRLHLKPAHWRWYENEDGSRVKDGNGADLGQPLSCIFVMLNPSTADGEKDDPTIRRCVSFAKALHFDRLEVVNLFAYRTKSPRELMALSHNDDPVGTQNQGFVERAAADAGKIIAAWGANGGHIGQDETVLGWLSDKSVYSLGLTSAGHPRHPLYLPGNSQLSRFRS